VTKVKKESMSCPNPPLPKQPSYYSFNGCRATLLDYIENKTHQDRYSTDYIYKAPYVKLDVPDYDVQPNEYPLSQICQCVASVPELGLNQAEIVQGENSMRLYTTYTQCVGEFDDRFMAAQM
jgi:hypothetical protein